MIDNIENILEKLLSDKVFDIEDAVDSIERETQAREEFAYEYGFHEGYDKGYEDGYSDGKYDAQLEL